MTTINPRPPHRETAAAAIFYAAAACAMTYPLVAQLGDHLPSDLGDPLLITSILAWDADRLRHGLAGVWDAPVFFPFRHTLLWSEHLLGIAIFTAPVNWLSRNPILAHNVAFLGAFAFAGFGMFCLVRYLSGRADAAVVSGLAFAFAPYRFAQLSRLHVLWTGWMPIALLAVHRYVDDRSSWRWAALGTTSFILLGLANGYYLFFFPVAILVVFAVDAAASRVRIGRALAHGAAAALAVLIVFGPIGAAYSTAREPLGARRADEEIEYYSADVATYLHVDDVVRLWRERLPGFGRVEGDAFPGLAILLLAAAGIATVRRRRDAPRTAAYAALAVIAFALSLGPHPAAFRHALPVPGPYAFLLRFVPGFGGLRVPARFAMIVLLAICVLGGLGLARLLVRLPPPLARGVAVVLGTIVLLEGAVGRMPTVRVNRQRDARLYDAVRASPAGAVLELPLQHAWSFSYLVYPFRTAPAFLNTQYEFAALSHRHPIVNGASGYESPFHTLLWTALDEGDVTGALQAARAADVGYVIARPPDVSAQATPPVSIDAISHEREQMATERRDGETALFELRPLRLADDPPGLIAVPARELRVETSLRSDAASNLIDGDVATPWNTSRAQSGDEWIRVRVDRPRPIARVRLELGTLVTDYPRRLVVEISTPAGDTRVVHEGSVLPMLARGLIRDPRRMAIDIVFAPSPAIAVTLRQTGRAPRMWWSIGELSLWEQPARP